LFAIQEGVQPPAHPLLQPEATRDQRRHVGEVRQGGGGGQEDTEEKYLLCIFTAV
jgi:hypothetical protein